MARESKWLGGLGSGGGGSGGSAYWGDAVASVGSLPASGVAVGEIRQAIDTGILYVWDGAAWVEYYDPNGLVARADIEPGTPDYVVINDPAGLLSEEAQLDQMRGGFGQDVSAVSGYAKAAAGVFSFSPIPVGDLPNNIPATKIADGSVDDTLFQRLTGLGRYESTSTILGGVLTINADPTKFDLSLGEGVIIDYSVDPHAPTFTDVSWSTSTAVPVTNLASNDNTYILINAAGTIVQQSTFPTPDQMRDMIYIGMLLHVNRTSINFIRSNGNHAESVGSHMMDFWNSVGPFNIIGNTIGPNGVNMTFAKSAGLMFSAFYNQIVNPKNPHEIPIGQQAPASFGYRTQAGGFDADSTLIDPNYYDVLGVKTLNAGAATTATVQRVFLLPTGDIRVQWGQFVYSSLAVALSNMGQEPFVTAPAVKGFGILIGYIALQKGTTSLNNLNQARVFSAGRFEIGPAAGALASTTWQQAYENSVPPVLVLDGTVGPAAIYDNPTPIGTDLFSVSDFAATEKYIQVDTEGVKSSKITPSTALVSDPNGAIVSLPGVSATEVSYLSAVTGDIQGQINSKGNLSDGLDQFAPTTSLELKSIITDETGSGPLVFGIEPIIDGGVASATSMITLPKASFNTLVALARKAGNALYSTDLGRQLIDNGSKLDVLGPGVGPINLISDHSNAQGWTKAPASAVFPTDPTTTVAAADLPLGGVTPSAIQISATGSGAEASNYVSYAVTTPASMSGKLQINFFQRPGAGFVSGQWTLSVYQGSTRQSLSSDSSAGVTTLSAINGPMTVSMDAIASTAYTLRFARTTGAGSATLNVANVFFGFPNITQGAAISDWQSYTPVFGSFTSVTSINMRWRRIGSSMEIQGEYTVGSTGASEIQIGLPTGYSISLPSGVNTVSLSTYLLSATSDTNHFFTVATNGDTFLNVSRWAADGSLNRLTPITGGGINVGRHSFTATVPIAEWAGNGTVNLGTGAQVEYSADDGTNDVFGPSGALVPNVAAGTGTTTRIFSFQYPQQITQSPNLEYFNGNGWANASDIYPFSSGNNAVATNAYGIKGYWSSTTQYTVEFGNQGTAVNISNASAGVASWASRFSAGDRFRVAKANPSSPVGFGLVDTNQAGLQRSYSSLAKIRVHTGNGYGGSTNNKIRRFTTTVVNTGVGVTYADSATLGASFTITEAGIYSFSYSDCFAVATGMGLSLNSTQLTTAVTSITTADRITLGSTAATSAVACVSVTLAFAVGDVIRPHTVGDTESAPDRASITVQRIG